MPSRQARISKSITKYGAFVVLQYKLGTNVPAAEDWPDPADPPTQVAPDPKTVKAIMVPLDAKGERMIVEEGQPVNEHVQGFFLATEDLNEVETVVWQTNEYHIIAQNAYELQGQILAQQALLTRRTAAVVRPHG